MFAQPSLRMSTSRASDIHHQLDVPLNLTQHYSTKSDALISTYIVHGLLVMDQDDRKTWFLNDENSIKQETDAAKDTIAQQASSRFNLMDQDLPEERVSQPSATVSPVPVPRLASTVIKREPNSDQDIKAQKPPTRFSSIDWNPFTQLDTQLGTVPHLSRSEPVVKQEPSVSRFNDPQQVSTRFGSMDRDDPKKPVSQPSPTVNIAQIPRWDMDVIKQDVDGGQVLNAQQLGTCYNPIDLSSLTQADSQSPVTTNPMLREPIIKREPSVSQGIKAQRVPIRFDAINWDGWAQPVSRQPSASVRSVESHELVEDLIKQAIDFDQSLKAEQGPIRFNSVDRRSPTEFFCPPSAAIDSAKTSRMSPTWTIDNSDIGHDLIKRGQPVMQPSCATAANTTPLPPRGSKRGPCTEPSLKAREQLMEQAATASVGMATARSRNEPPPMLSAAVSDTKPPSAANSQHLEPQSNSRLEPDAHLTLTEVHRRLTSLKDKIKSARSGTNNSKLQGLLREREHLLEVLRRLELENERRKHSGKPNPKSTDDYTSIDYPPRSTTSGAASTKKRPREPSPDDEMEVMTEIITQINRITKRVSGLPNKSGSQKRRNGAAEGLAVALRASANELLATTEDVTRYSMHRDDWFEHRPGRRADYYYYY
ncbi:MAG: hypothetical protein Q9169_003826 [Polycauliona sp. 2 TL-2023]